MATTKFYLDTRRTKEKVYPLRINICHLTKTAANSLGIKLAVNQWNPIEKEVINHPEAKFWTNFISRKKLEIDTLLLKMEDDPMIQLSKMTVVEIKDYNISHIDPEKKKVICEPKEDPNTFIKWFDHFLERKKGRTKEIYDATKIRLIDWLGEDKLSSVKFEDIKVSWLEEFNDYLLERNNSINSISIHLRNIRAVVNYAIDNDITSYYAFRRFKIRNEPTRKRNYDIDTLRKIFNQGRVEYIRSKTHRSYSIKVEKEAKEIIDKYSGEKHLVNFIDTYENYRHFYNNLWVGLNSLKEQLGLKELTTYWARHSWATIARKIGISKDTIALALGHGSHTVTDIYIEDDMKEVDEANRRVLNYVLYGYEKGIAPTN